MVSKKPKQNYATQAGTSNVRDRCQTPYYAVNPLIPYLKADWRLWEPARGEGLLEATLKRQGFAVVTGDVLTGQDYFADASMPAAYDAQITNPPFSLKYKWLERAYKLGKPFALIMPVDVFGSSTAQRLFAQYGIEVILMDQRVDYKMPEKGFSGAGSQFNSAWFTWGLNIGRTLTYAKLHKPQKRAIHSFYNGQISMFEEVG